MASGAENVKQAAGCWYCVLCRVEGRQGLYRLTYSDSTSNQSRNEEYRVSMGYPVSLTLRLVKETTSLASQPIKRLALPRLTLTRHPVFVKINNDSGEKHGEVAAVEDELTIGQHTLHHVIVIVALDTDTCFATAKDRGRLVTTCKDDCEIEVVGLVIDVVENVEVGGRCLRFATLAYHLSDVLAAFSREHFGVSPVGVFLLEDHFRETCRPVCDQRLVRAMYREVK